MMLPSIFEKQKIYLNLTKSLLMSVNDGIFFNSLSRQFSIASLLRCVSDFTTDIFSLEKELFSWTYSKKKAPQRAKILISLVWNKILKIWDNFWAHKYRAHCSKN